MLYHNTKYKFPLWGGSPDDCRGGIIAASAMPLNQLKEREKKKTFAKYTYLKHRLFDPQLYLATLDPARARSTVEHLTSYPWFGAQEREAYDKSKHKTLTKYENENAPHRVKQWTRSVPTDPRAIAQAVKMSVQMQVDLGCEGIILPSPLIDRALPGFSQGTAWIDAGIIACSELKVQLPIYATIALCDTLIDNRPAVENTFISAITEQIAAREGLAGAYVIVETADGDAYSFQSGDVADALLIVADDLIRGAGRQMIVNYSGSFGAVLAGAGAEIWATGYYRTQRRLKRADFTLQPGGGSRPRYFSLPLAGDVGVEKDIDAIIKAKLFRRVFTPTPPAELLHAALRAGRKVEDVPSWEYAQSNVTAAGAHYNTCMVRLGAELDALNSNKRPQFVEDWLSKAVGISDELKKAGIVDSQATELNHQATWLKAFQAWRKRSRR